MDNSHHKNSAACSQNCEELFRECLHRGNGETVCRIQRAPCDSSCWDA